MNEDNQNKETVIEEFHERMPRRWPLLLLYLFLALVVAVLVVFGVRALYRHDHPTVKTTPVSVKTRPVESSTSGSSGTSNTSSSTAGGTSTSLPNSGPGQVVSLFVGTAIAAAGLHYLTNLRRGARQ